ncbi:hypothetical protein [Vreelandella aquamarina]|uniref:hypothetical protein n=1 Tax=Vreelandella aquamarina TaxID=77097 RepID=UPI0015880617|nr:hypothetical protein [Halomonas meridiana]
MVHLVAVYYILEVSIVTGQDHLEALPDDGQPGVAGEGAATGAELYVGHGTVWVNGDNGYIAMQVSGLEVLPGAGLTDSGISLADSSRNSSL